MAWRKRRRHPLRWIALATLVAGAFYWRFSRGRVHVRDPLVEATFGPQAFASGCGVERWAVKTLSDPQADSVLSAKPKRSTIKDLNMVSRGLGYGGVRAPEELQQYEVDASIVEWRNEDDGDVHLIMIDEAGYRIVGEFAHPACVGNPAAQQKIAEAREQLVEVLSSTQARTGNPIPVTIRGPLFFDREHGQRGAAFNGAELHPVLEIHVRD